MINITQSADLIHVQNYTTDANGLISVNFISAACSSYKNCNKDLRLYIRVHVADDVQPQHYNGPLFSSSTGFSLQAWNSKLENYLQIYRQDNLKKSVDCGEYVNFDVKIKSNEAAIGNLYFQIQSKSAVLYSGSYNLDTNEKILNMDEVIYSTDTLKIRKIEKRESERESGKLYL